MVDRNFLLKKLNPYVGTMQIVKYDQGTQDIIAELLKSHAEQAKEYDKIYPYFVGKNIRQTAKNIFDYLKSNVKYNIEPASKQTLKSASSIVAQGYGDCKQYAQFAGGILDAIKRNIKGADWCYRFASYNNQKIIQHVFVVVKDKNGKEIWIDPVLDQFDYHKAYTYKQDKTPNMALYRISGMDQQVGKISLKKLSLKNVGKAVKKVAKPISKIVKVATSATPAGAAKNLIKSGIKKAVQKGAAKAAVKKVAKAAIKKAANGGLKKIVVQVGTAASRNAFLTIVKANKNGIATKLGAAMARNEQQIKDIWQGLGGKYNVLQSTILAGSRNAISGVSNPFYVNGIGAIDPSKVYLAALPVINKFNDILKDVGVDVDQLLTKGSQEAVTQVDEALAVDQNNNLVDNPSTPSSDVSQVPVIEPNQQDQTVENVETTVQAKGDTAVVDLQSTGTSGDYKKFIIPAVALAAIYFISKKK
jgi:hypothetical protein